MDAATSWAELAQKPEYIAAAARRKGVPEHAIEDVVGDAVLECLERSAKGQGFPRQSIATRGLIGSAVRRAMRLSRLPEKEMSNRREFSEEDEATMAQIKEWVSLSGRERLQRARESRIALGTSLTVETAGAGNSKGLGFRA